MEIVDLEPAAWLRAADVAGVQLPADIVEARERLRTIDEEYGQLATPAPMPTASELVADGTPLDEAASKVEELTVEARRLAEKHRVASEALWLARRRINEAVAQHRDGLIVECARPVVTALVEQARPLADLLTEFAPEYAPQSIVRNASPDQIEAWRAAQALELELGAVLAAWRRSMKTNRRTGGQASPAKLFPAFDGRWVPEAYHFWTVPEHVTDPKLGGRALDARGRVVRIRPTVLGVAAEPPEAGFRLAAEYELKAIHDTIVAEQRAGVRDRRGRVVIV